MEQLVVAAIAGVVVAIAWTLAQINAKLGRILERLETTAQEPAARLLRRS